MQIKPEEITSVLKRALEGADGRLELAEVGYVLQVGDGIARIYGLEQALAAAFDRCP